MPKIKRIKLEKDKQSVIVLVSDQKRWLDKGWEKINVKKAAKTVKEK